MSIWQPDVPHNSLPPIPGPGILETPRVLKATIGARVALARLDEASASMPNPTVLINSIPLLEAQASSEIENIVTTTDALFIHMNDEAGADAATRETLRYRTALRKGHALVLERGVTATTAAAICTIIKGTEMTVRNLPGTRIGNPQTKKVVYSPPEGREVIEAKLTGWERFVNGSRDIDPLVRMAAAHYQFEAIHPFTDGNGRTGRILNVLTLVNEGLLRLPVLYLSRYIIDTKREYYDRLLAVTAHGDWEGWLLYILAGVEATADATVNKIGRIRDLQTVFEQEVRSALHGGVDIGFMATLFEQPYCRIANVQERCEVSRPTATKWLRALVQADLLGEIRMGREVLFVNRPYLTLLAE